MISDLLEPAGGEGQIIACQRTSSRKRVEVTVDSTATGSEVQLAFRHVGEAPLRRQHLDQAWQP
jgi:hypothetical protein